MILDIDKPQVKNLGLTKEVDLPIRVTYEVLRAVLGPGNAQSKPALAMEPDWAPLGPKTDSAAIGLKGELDICLFATTKPRCLTNLSRRLHTLQNPPRRRSQSLKILC